MGNPLHKDPITGPFPDGDSRNLTLTQSGNAFEPERTGPQEPVFRGDDAPGGVIGDLARSELQPGAEPPAPNRNPEWTQLGEDSLGERMNRLTPGSQETSLMGDLLEKVGKVFDLDLGGATTGDESDGPTADTAASSTSINTSINQGAENARAAHYTLREDPQPSAAQTAFGRPGGNQEEPLLQEDWNPAERNSDDLSR